MSGNSEIVFDLLSPKMSAKARVNSGA